MSNVTLELLMNEKVIHTIRNPEVIPTTVGIFIEVPDTTSGLRLTREFYIAKILNKYPLPGSLDQQTIVQCEGAYA